MKRTTPAADVKRMAALQKQNAELQGDLRQETGRAVRAERELTWERYKAAAR